MEKAEFPFLQIAAVVPEGLAVESTLVRDHLPQFTLELGVRFQVEFPPVSNLRNTLPQGREVPRQQGHSCLLIAGDFSLPRFGRQGSRVPGRCAKDLPLVQWFSWMVRGGLRQHLRLLPVVAW
ncbi:hypothetical protein VNO77_20060 [Canavalia gladiata]|uniref:Uncharacterized protein n=1 Tax=Canavalia gladiata TaxID=3824 RepID=A0AAN9QM22_CANGL